MNLSRGSGGTPGGLPAAAPPYIVYVPLGPRPSPHRHPPKSEARTTTGLVRRVCEEGPCRSTDTAPLAFPCAGAHKRRAPKGAATRTRYSATPCRAPHNQTQLVSVVACPCNPFYRTSHRLTQDGFRVDPTRALSDSTFRVKRKWTLPNVWSYPKSRHPRAR